MKVSQYMGREEQRRLANLEIHPAKGAGWSGGGAPFEEVAELKFGQDIWRLGGGFGLGLGALQVGAVPVG
jgi:hypothetical protein